MIRIFKSSHLTRRGGKDPARLIQEELQGPLEATAHADEGEEGKVRASTTNKLGFSPNQTGVGFLQAAAKGTYFSDWLLSV